MALDFLSIYFKTIEIPFHFQVATPPVIASMASGYRDRLRHSSICEVKNIDINLTYGSIMKYGEYCNNDLLRSLLLCVIYEHGHFNILKEVAINLWITIDGIDPSEHVISCHRNPAHRHSTYIDQIFEMSLLWNHVPSGDIYMEEAKYSYF